MCVCDKDGSIYISRGCNIVVFFEYVVCSCRKDYVFCVGDGCVDYYSVSDFFLESFCKSFEKLNGLFLVSYGRSFGRCKDLFMMRFNGMSLRFDELCFIFLGKDR